MLSTLIGGRVKQRLSAESDRGWWPFAYSATSSGQIVNAETAPRVAAVFACVRVLSETMASAPCIVYRRKKPSGKSRATDSGIYSVLHHAPNQWQTAFEFWEMAMMHLALRGNFYAVIVPGLKGAVTELIPLHPDRMKSERIENGRIRYKFTDPETSRPEYYAQDEIFHIRGMSPDGLTGVSVIQYSKETIGGAMAADKYASTFFKNDATPGLVLTTEQPLTADARRETGEQWNKKHAGSDRAHTTAVLSNGLKPIALGVNNRDSQFIEARNYSRSEIASIFRVPPHLIGDMEHATFSNIEQQSLEFVMYTMLPWFRRIEAAIARDLIVDESLYAEFLVDGLLRGDIVSRYNAYATGRNNGWLNTNEIRELENMNDIGPEGDVYFVQGAMITLDRAINPPEPKPPFVPQPKPQPEPQDMRPVIELVSNLVVAKDEVIRAKDAVIVSKDVAISTAEAAIAAEVQRASAIGELASERAVQLASAAVTSQQQQSAIEERESALNIARDQCAIHEKNYGAAASAAEALREKLGTVTQGIKKLAADELRGLIRLEVNAIQRASHKHDFLSALDKFYGEQRQRMEESMRDPLSLLSATCGIEHDGASLAEAHCGESTKSLLNAAGTCGAKDLPETITQLMATWEQRAAFLEN